MTPNFSSTLDPAMDPGFLQEASIKARYVRFGPFCIDQHRLYLKNRQTLFLYKEADKSYTLFGQDNAVITAIEL